jgi:hypothetical protein
MTVSLKRIVPHLEEMQAHAKLKNTGMNSSLTKGYKWVAFCNGCDLSNFLFKALQLK